MTTPVEGEWLEDEPQSGNIPVEEAWQQETGIPVRIVEQPHERESPEFAGMNTYTIGQAGTVSAPPYCTQILQRRYRRFKAKFGPVVFGTGCTAVILNTVPDSLSNPATAQGFTLAATGQVMPDYDAERPLYAIAIGGSATLPVMDESYGDYRTDYSADRPG